MATPRLPAHVEVGGLIRATAARGGFGTVLAKGEPDSGTLLVICCERGTQARAYERLPQVDGTRQWVLARTQDPENPQDFAEFCNRRRAQDRDLWILELDVANAEQLIGLPPARG